MDSWSLDMQWYKMSPRMDSWLILLLILQTNLGELPKNQVNLQDQLVTSQTHSPSLSYRFPKIQMLSKTHKMWTFIALSKPTTQMGTPIPKRVARISWLQWWYLTRTSTRLRATTHRTAWLTWRGATNRSRRALPRCTPASLGTASRALADL